MIGLGKAKKRMNLLNEIVMHKTFGQGTITLFDEKYVTVDFVSGQKKFVFPDTFGSHLTAQNATVSDLIAAEITHNNDEILRLKMEEEAKISRAKEFESLVQSEVKKQKKTTRTKKVK